MAYHRSILPAALDDYVRTRRARAKPTSPARLREETARLPQAGMQIGADEAALLALLVRMLGARRALEIGTFTGYSALAIAARAAARRRARVLRREQRVDGHRAARIWAEAGVAERIDLRIAPAAQDTLRRARRRGPATARSTSRSSTPTSPATTTYYERCAAAAASRTGSSRSTTRCGRASVADPARDDESTVALARSTARSTTTRAWTRACCQRRGRRHLGTQEGLSSTQSAAAASRPQRRLAARVGFASYQETSRGSSLSSAIDSWTSASASCLPSFGTPFMSSGFQRRASSFSVETSRLR